MREENYFVKKLEISKETLNFTKNKLEHLDVQMNVLELMFARDKRLYNEQAIHMQKIVADMEKRIPELEKKIAQGYVAIDMRTGKAYKSYEERHVGLLKDKIKAAEEEQKEGERARKERQALKRKKYDRLTPEELDLIAADEVREEAQPADELNEVREKERERLEAKAEKYRLELEALKTKSKEKPEEVKEPEVEVPIPPKEIKEDEEALLEEVGDIVGEKLSGLHEGKTQCPECRDWYTKGGAFAKHYQSHFNGD